MPIGNNKDAGMNKILIINGPNLNLLGKREESIYGNKSFEELLPKLQEYALNNKAEIEYFQSNHEGKIIDKLHESMGIVDNIILNPGALTHYSYSLHDAILSVEIPVIEVHISNIFKRDDWRAKSVISPAAEGIISGFGFNGYIMALDFILKKTINY
jgi:3-dehydroquinate dehydratase-2